MSVSSIAPISPEALDAVYTSRNIALATTFAVSAQPRLQREKDVRSEDDAIDASLHEAERVAATAAALLAFRRNNKRDGQRHRKRSRPFATFDDILDDEQPPSFDNYA